MLRVVSYGNWPACKLEQPRRLNLNGGEDLAELFFVSIHFFDHFPLSRRYSKKLARSFFRRQQNIHAHLQQIECVRVDLRGEAQGLIRGLNHARGGVACAAGQRFFALLRSNLRNLLVAVPECVDRRLQCLQWKGRARDYIIHARPGPRRR